MMSRVEGTRVKTGGVCAGQSKIGQELSRVRTVGDRKRKRWEDESDKSAHGGTPGVAYSAGAADALPPTHPPCQSPTLCPLLLLQSLQVPLRTRR